MKDWIYARWVYYNGKMFVTFPSAKYTEIYQGHLTGKGYVHGFKG